MEWSRIPSLAALRAFEAAARNKGFSLAARELNVTHAAIAQHVRSLEQEFGEQLIERSGRGVAVTESGWRLAERLRDGFGTIAEGIEELRAHSIERPLMVSVTPAFAAHWLMPRIGEFWQLHRDIPININPSAELIDLRADHYDLAVRYGDGDWPGLDAELLTDGDYWAVVHPDLIGDRKVESLRDVTDLPWLIESYMVERRTIIEQEGIDYSSLDVTVLMTNDLVMAAAEAGLGVTVQPKSLVEREIARGLLVKVCELPDVGLAYHMVTVPGRVSERLDVFMGWLRRRARDM